MKKNKRFWPKAKRMLVLSDMHCGHVCGLTHPDFNISYSDESSDNERLHRSRRIRQTKQRRTLWKWCADRIDAFRPFDVVLHNGDAIEGTGHRSGGTELLCTDRDEQVSMAQAVLDFVSKGSADIYMTYGTGYHTGTEEDWEDVLAREVKAKKIEGEAHFDVNGIQIAAKHKIGGSKSPASRYTALSNSQIRQTLWALRGQQPEANIIIRSHVHRCLAVMEPGTHSLAFTTPALEGLGSKYGIRQVDGLPVEFGIVVLDLLDVDHVMFLPQVSPLEMQRCSVTKL